MSGDSDRSSATTSSSTHPREPSPVCCATPPSPPRRCTVWAIGVTAPVRLLAPGDELRVAVRLLPGVRIPLRTRITHVDAGGMTSVLARGPLKALAHVVTLTPSPVGTWLRDELRWTGPLGPFGRLADRVLVRRAMRRVLAARAEVIAARAEELAAAPAVVATALIRDGRLLVAQRTRPPALAGRWELPGGRVEPGEDEAAAVVAGVSSRSWGRRSSRTAASAPICRSTWACCASTGPARRRGHPSRGRWSTRRCGGSTRRRCRRWTGWTPTAPWSGTSCASSPRMGGVRTALVRAPRVGTRDPCAA